MNKAELRGTHARLTSLHNRLPEDFPLRLDDLCQLFDEFNDMLSSFSFERSDPIYNVIDEMTLNMWPIENDLGFAKASRGVTQKKYYDSARKKLDYIITNLLNVFAGALDEVV